MSLPVIQMQGIDCLVDPVLSWWDKEIGLLIASHQSRSSCLQVKFAEYCEECRYLFCLSKFLTASADQIMVPVAFKSPSPETVKEDSTARKLALDMLSD